MISKPHNQLITALLNDSAYDHATDKIELLETHISWVILTGNYVYKIKKPVNLGFLDFSTLEKRHFYCNEELRLNSRLAPVLYLSVVTINGSKHKPQINGKGKVIEYAVKMHQFPQQAQFDRLLKQEQLTKYHIDTLAKTVANFHNCAKIADNQSNYGNPETIITPVSENFTQIKQQENFSFNLDKLEKLSSWSTTFFKQHENDLFLRKNKKFIRECHGDMHLQNIAHWQKKLLIFDCLEFDDKLRWIDVISEVAFVVMDLDERNYQNLAWRFLNTYLEQTGDYAGITVLRFYLVYRAMVRAKVNCILTQQKQVSNLLKLELKQKYENYINLALKYISKKQPSLIIMHGFSGSGKTVLSQRLLEKNPLIRLRSDIERKRIFGLDVLSNSHSVIGNNLYTNVATEKTYQHLFKLARPMLQNNWTVLIDASFLNETHRQQAKQLAIQNKAQFIILDCFASDDVLHQRIAKRLVLNNDASEADQAVLENQIKNNQSLTNKELEYTYHINTESSFNNINLVNKLVI